MSMSAGTPTGNNGPPPIPPSKPVLSSPGNMTGSGTPVTAGIHSVNKSHTPTGVGGEKPAIAARPIPPPTLPKYSSSFNKVDRERNDFSKLDRADREKDGIGGSYRLASLDRLANRQRILEQNGGLGNVTLERNGKNHDNSNGTAANTTTMNGNTITSAVTLQSKREMFFSATGAPPTPPTNHVTTATSQNSTTNDKNHINGNTSQINGAQITPASANNNHTTGISLNSNPSSTTTTPTVNNVNSLTNSINHLTLKEKQQQLIHNTTNGNGSIDNNHSDSNKIANDRYDKEKHHLLKDTTTLSSIPPTTATQPTMQLKRKELDGYVGFANLPNQVYRKAVKKGFEFTLMVVGETGLGKSTLINSMFLADIYNQDQYPGPSMRIKKTVAVEATKVLLKENGVNLTLTVVDTPGFGDAVDNSNCWMPVIDFVESKCEEYLTAESRVHRKAIPDTRVHCCLYFIAPSGHGLKPLDVEFMQRLCDKVNIIPVIAKADTMTPEEIQLFKKQILNEIAQHKIKIYDFPDPQDDDEEVKVLKQLKSRVPFAVVGANTVMEVDGKKVRGRRYPWGIVEVESLDHCDFLALRNMVIRNYLQDLKDITNSVHYENYRCKKLAGLGSDGKVRLTNKNPLAQMEEEKREHDLKMKKMEAEMEQVFEMKVKEKKQKLKDSEVELTRRHEDRKKALEQQIRELEERRRAFEQEKKEWEETNNITLDELRRRSLEANSKETVDGKDKKDKKKKGLF